MKKNKKNNEVEMVYGPLLYANHLRGFLGVDPYVTVECDDENQLINVIVTGCKYKAECLEAILITNEEFEKFCHDDKYNLCGYKIVVNGKRPSWRRKITQSVINAALAGNPLYKGIEKHSVKTPMGKTISRWFGMFKPEVCQAPVDNFGNPYGIQTFTPEEFVKYAFCDKARKVVAWATDRK